MRQRPNRDEKLKNVAVFLAFARLLSSSKGTIGDRLKVQKCTFLVTLDQFRRRLKGFNLTFFRYDWGPYSKQLWELKDELVGARLIEENARPDSEVGYLALTEQGRSVADRLYADISTDESNAEFIQGMQEVVERFGPEPTQKILDHVYGLELQPATGGPKERVRDMRFHVDLTRVLDRSEARAEIAIPDAWLETLAILLSAESRDGLSRAQEDLAHKRVRDHSEVWA